MEKVEYQLNEVLCVSNAQPICFDLFPTASPWLHWYFNCDKDICFRAGIVCGGTL